QVRGLARMLEEDRYCIDILHQIQAVKTALKKAETELLRAHARECVEDALKSGSIRDRREKIVELVELFERARQARDTAPHPTEPPARAPPPPPSSGHARPPP